MSQTSIPFFIFVLFAYKIDKAGVPLTDYKRIGGSAVGGSIG